MYVNTEYIIYIIKMTHNIKSNSIDFVSLINNDANLQILNDNLYSKIVEKMKHEFTEEQQQWYMANMYMYLHYHPIDEYPINLENIWKIIGFANKWNAKRTLENNFIENDDYTFFIRREESLIGGRPKETIMLNIDTFKNLCMLAKTDA